MSTESSDDEFPELNAENVPKEITSGAVVKLENLSDLELHSDEGIVRPRPLKRRRNSESSDLERIVATKSSLPGPSKKKPIESYFVNITTPVPKSSTDISTHDPKLFEAVIKLEDSSGLELHCDARIVRPRPLKRQRNSEGSDLERIMVPKSLTDIHSFESMSSWKPRPIRRRRSAIDTRPSSVKSPSNRSIKESPRPATDGNNVIEEETLDITNPETEKPTSYFKVTTVTVQKKSSTHVSKLPDNTSDSDSDSDELRSCNFEPKIKQQKIISTKSESIMSLLSSLPGPSNKFIIECERLATGDTYTINEETLNIIAKEPENPASSPPDPDSASTSKQNEDSPEKDTAEKQSNTDEENEDVSGTCTLFNNLSL